jgi:hypothetical protein
MSSIEVSNVRTTEASLLGDQLDERRTQLRRTPDRPRGRPGRRTALAVHLMANTAVTRATYHIDRGQQLVSQ